jgi:hypothetical protein
MTHELIKLIDSMEISQLLDLINQAKQELKRRVDSDKETAKQRKIQLDKTRREKEISERLTVFAKRYPSYLPKYDDGKDHTPFYKKQG